MKRAVFQTALFILGLICDRIYDIIVRQENDSCNPYMWQHCLFPFTCCHVYLSRIKPNAESCLVSIPGTEDDMSSVCAEAPADVPKAGFFVYIMFISGLMF